MMKDKRVGFVGGGMMCEAMLGGLLKGGLPAGNVVISEPNEQRRKYLAEMFKVRIAESNDDVCQQSDVVVMAVKPQVVDKVLADIRSAAVAKCLVVSIVAGKTLATFAQHHPNARVARVMPNTPSLVGCGACCYVLNQHCLPEDSGMVEAVMGACGIVERVADEKLLDAVTGLSGSGPAYVYLLIEAMSDGGVRMGLPRATATRLAAQTVMGAGKMALETGQHPGQLKDAVTSPGGTTIAGVHALEGGGFRGTVMNAVEAATKRCTELGK
jgi:pyrroline-5-carboxylate reductase